MIALFDTCRSHARVHRHRHPSQQPAARRLVRDGAAARCCSRRHLPTGRGLLRCRGDGRRDRSDCPGSSSTVHRRRGCSMVDCSHIHCCRRFWLPACAARPTAAVSRWIGWGPLRVTGVLSYSLYLWHWPVFALLSPQRTGMSGWSLQCLRFAVAFAAAAVSKIVVEDPVRFRAKWARGRAGVATLIAATAAVAAFWVLVPRPETAPAVFSLDQFASTTASPTSAAPPSTTASSVNTSISAPTSIAPASQATLGATTTSTRRFRHCSLRHCSLRRAEY